MALRIGELPALIQDEELAVIRLEKSAVNSKVVVRGLPPTITESVFRSSVQSVTADLDISPADADIWFVDGVKRVSLTKPAVPARGYVYFRSPNQAETFIKKYNAQVFVDERGDSFRIAVCKAPFSRPLEPNVPLPDEGKIESSEEFKAYMELLENPPTPEAPAEPPTIRQAALVQALLASPTRLPRMQEGRGRRRKQDNAGPSPKARNKRRRGKKEKKANDALQVLKREPEVQW